MAVANCPITLRGIYRNVGTGSSQTWAQARAGTGTHFGSYWVGFQHVVFNGDRHNIYRSVLSIDTSAIPAGSVITGAYFDVSVTNNVLIYGGSYVGTRYWASIVSSANDGTSLSHYEIANFGSIKYGTYALGAPAVGHEDDVELNAGGSTPITITLNADGMAAIVPEGTTLFGVLTSHDLADTDPGTGAGELYLESTIDLGAAELVVTYSPASPPADPTLLAASCSTGIGESTLANAPTTQFSADVTSGLAPLTVNFTDTSGQTPTSWLWEIDGATYTTQNASHVFAAPGIYPVRLTATNAEGSRSYQMTIIATETPVVSPPGDGTVTPGGTPGNELIQSLYGQIGYYVVDTDGHQIGIHGADGALLKSFGGLGSTAGKFFNPTTCSIVNGRQLIDRAQVPEE